jgi:hypothetical protein
VGEEEPTAGVEVLVEMNGMTDDPGRDGPVGIGNVDPSGWGRIPSGSKNPLVAHDTMASLAATESTGCAKRVQK